jgi:hypothetical protein
MPTPPSKEPRPPRRDKRIDVPVDPDTYDRALKKAGKLSRLRAVIRAFLDLWADNEIQEVPEEEIVKQERRAKKRKKPKK